MIRMPLLCLLGLITTLDYTFASSLATRERRGSSRHCDMSDLMGLSSAMTINDASACTELLMNAAPTGTLTNPDPEEDIAIIEAILPDLCGECMEPINVITSALANMQCDLQLSLILTGLQMASMYAGDSVDASQIATMTSSVNGLIAQGITEITHEEFQGLHDIVQDSCQVTDTGDTCAQEFMALSSPTSSQHTTVCERISDACVDELTVVATTLNEIGNSLCVNSALNADLATALCMQHSTESVLRAVSQQCTGGGPTLSPEQIHQSVEQNYTTPERIHQQQNSDANKGMSGSMIALIAIAALGATVGVVFAGRSLWLKRKSSYNPVEMYDFNDNNDEDDDWDDENNDDKLLSVLDSDTPLGLQTPELEAANRLELMSEDE